MLIHRNSKVSLFDVIWNNKTMEDKGCHHSVSPVWFRLCALNTSWVNKVTTRVEKQPQQGDLAHQLVSPVAFSLFLRLCLTDSATLLAVRESRPKRTNQLSGQDKILTTITTKWPAPLGPKSTQEASTHLNSAAQGNQVTIYNKSKQI